MRRATFGLATAGLPPAELGHHAVEVGALGDALAVAAMRRDDPVAAITVLLQLVGLALRSVGAAARQYASIPRVARGARERDGVAHIRETGDIGEGALKPEAEPGVRHRAIAAQIAVPGVLVPVDAALRHAAV